MPSKAAPKMTKEQADSLRRGGRYSPDGPFVVDFADPHNPYREATPEEKVAMDAEQKAFAAAQKQAEADRLADAQTAAGAAPAPGEG